MIILETKKKTTINTDQDFILCHHNEIILNILTRKIKTIQAVHQKIIINMLKEESNYKNSTESNYYQNEFFNSNLQEPDNIQETTKYTPRVIKTNSNLNSIYQNTIK